MTTTTKYGKQLLAAIERARTVAPSSGLTKAERQAEIIALALQGFTVPQLRALYVAHFSGQPMARGLSRAKVVETLRTTILTTLEA